MAISNLSLPASAFPQDLGPVCVDAVTVGRMALVITERIELVVEGVDVQLYQPRMPQVCWDQ